MKRWFQEPLLHFLVAGGLLFAAYSWINHDVGDKPQVVHISAAEVNWLKESWARQWHQPPDAQELRGLVTDYLKEELLAREAQEMGLDKDDTIVRRRLAQKMEFLVQDTVGFVEPRDEELRRLYEDNRARYHTPARISFSQIYFKTEVDARRGLQALKARNEPVLGDRTMLERDYDDADGRTVTTLFGPAFSEALFALTAGQWQGPVRSGYGFHLVRISERQARQLRTFKEARAEVAEQWRRELQDRTNKQFFTSLFKKYDVQVDDSVKALIGPLTEVVMR